ncbi:MAG: type II toxin-antitoxin system mRNA interferase toxin, RelE/StbE family [Planctomycetes bacterium]|nr:type II toxin-antitoxin system mRNA interferase toxin, RelE/StbE family [Planctomycetota bacterium]
MWEIFEHRNLVRKLPRIPVEVLKRYEIWKDIVIISGPEGLRQIKGFHDEALRGDWKGHRSSRLGKQYHVIYKIANQQLYVQVINLAAHDYRRK